MAFHFPSLVLIPFPKLVALALRKTDGLMRDISNASVDRISGDMQKVGIMIEKFGKPTINLSCPETDENYRSYFAPIEVNTVKILNLEDGILNLEGFPVLQLATHLLQDIQFSDGRHRIISCDKAFRESIYDTHVLCSITTFKDYTQMKLDSYKKSEERPVVYASIHDALECFNVPIKSSLDLEYLKDQVKNTIGLTKSLHVERYCKLLIHLFPGAKKLMDTRRDCMIFSQNHVFGSFGKWFTAIVQESGRAQLGCFRYNLGFALCDLVSKEEIQVRTILLCDAVSRRVSRLKDKPKVLNYVPMHLHKILKEKNDLKEKVGVLEIPNIFFRALISINGEQRNEWKPEDLENAFDEVFRGTTFSEQKVTTETKAISSVETPVLDKDSNQTVREEKPISASPVRPMEGQNCAGQDIAASANVQNAENKNFVTSCDPKTRGASSEPVSPTEREPNNSLSPYVNSTSSSEDNSEPNALHSELNTTETSYRSQKPASQVYDALSNVPDQNGSQKQGAIPFLTAACQRLSNENTTSAGCLVSELDRVGENSECGDETVCRDSVDVVTVLANTDKHSDDDSLKRQPTGGEKTSDRTNTKIAPDIGLTRRSKRIQQKQALAASTPRKRPLSPSLPERHPRKKSGVSKTSVNTFKRPLEPVQDTDCIPVSAQADCGMNCLSLASSLLSRVIFLRLENSGRSFSRIEKQPKQGTKAVVLLDEHFMERGTYVKAIEEIRAVTPDIKYILTISCNITESFVDMIPGMALKSIGTLDLARQKAKEDQISQTTVYIRVFSASEGCWKGPAKFSSTFNDAVDYEHVIKDFFMSFWSRTGLGMGGFSIYDLMLSFNDTLQTPLELGFQGFFLRLLQRNKITVGLSDKSF